MAAEHIPFKMKALVLNDYDGTALSLERSEIPVPALKPGQVLIKIAAAAVNPSDLVFLRGAYGIVKALPVVPGFEGSGTVVASGGGILGRWLIGKRVACHAPSDSDGTWAEYMAAPAKDCIPLFKNISLEQGATLIVNPMTACALIDIARAGHHPSFVQTAAAGALGLMIARLGQRYGMTGIHIVRRQEQVALLKAQGAEYVFDTSDPLFMDRLSEACYKFKATIAFDAVGGELTGRVASAMPAQSRVIVYGALSNEACRVRPVDLIFYNERLEGFWLTEWINHKSLLSHLQFGNRVQRLLHTDLQTNVQARFPLDGFADAFALYKKQRTDGKVLLIPPSGN